METPMAVADLSPYLAFASDPMNQHYKTTDAANFSNLPPWLQELSHLVSRSLRETGALIVKDPRCRTEDNDLFIDMMEKYFEKPPEFKRMQERPQLHYQVGVTPERVELPRSFLDEDMQQKMKLMPEEHRPLLPDGPDRKWRYMWRIGPRPLETRFKELNSEPVIPEGFPEWEATMNAWGYKMISAVEMVAELAALGFGLPRDAFTSIMKLGPHLLAPTGSDLSHHGRVGTVFAGYHYDLNFLTIHGRSRFPGLNIWLRNGEKVEVKVPPGCLLVQSGKQLEWLTAGECTAGMHEVVVTSHTAQAIKSAAEHGHSLWRVSSTVRNFGLYYFPHSNGQALAPCTNLTGYARTHVGPMSAPSGPLWPVPMPCHPNTAQETGPVLIPVRMTEWQGTWCHFSTSRGTWLFAHIASDAELKPLGCFAESPNAAKYPCMPAGEYVEQELSFINLKGKNFV